MQKAAFFSVRHTSISTVQSDILLSARLTARDLLCVLQYVDRSCHCDTEKKNTHIVKVTHISAVMCNSNQNKVYLLYTVPSYYCFYQQMFF